MLEMTPKSSVHYAESGGAAEHLVDGAYDHAILIRIMNPQAPPRKNAQYVKASQQHHILRASEQVNPWSFVGIQCLWTHQRSTSTGPGAPSPGSHEARTAIKKPKWVSDPGEHHTQMHFRRQADFH